MYPPATKLLNCYVQTDVEYKFSDFVDGGNGCLYGIPSGAPRVVEYNLEDKSIKEIGPYLGDECGKYTNGIKANNGSIYCMPHLAQYLLKITPGKGHYAEVQRLEEKQLSFEQHLPEGRWKNCWNAGALANDSCIYYFPYELPYDFGRILKLDPNDGDSLSIVGEEINGGFDAAVLGNDGYIYVVSDIKIINFNPIDHRVSCIGRKFEHGNNLWTGAVLAEDGNIYAANRFEQILRIDTSENDWEIIECEIYDGEYYDTVWGSPAIGADKCIYFPPACHDRVLKFNPSTQSISLVGESYGIGSWKWRGSVLASDGYIYCIPHDANDILQIDSRHVNEQVIGMIENLQRNDKNIVENATEVKKRKRFS